LATFVLVPGAGIDPRVYGRMIDELRELGHEGLAPPLPLDDPDAGPSAHARAIVGAVRASLGEGRPDRLVVVGQSLGAFAASLAAADLAADLLVLVAPMIPAPGETAGEWWEATGHGEAIAGAVERHGPMGQWGPEAMEDVFLHDVDPGVLPEAERYDGPPGPGMFTEPWPRDSWVDVPTRVLAPREDRLFPLAFQRRVARERLGLEVDELSGGHLPMLSRPGELARRLGELADKVPARWT